MATALTIGTVPLEEIHDLHWPTDRHLVGSFRKTLQHGGHFAPMHLNRVWHPETTWRYEVIDGFHRYEAAKAEGVTSLLCQVVELEAREARYARIQACVGKPAEITRDRALRELRLAFVSDMRALLGTPDGLYEPILGEEGQVEARPRKAPLPEEPLAALEVLTDHLLATQTEAQPYLVQRGQQVVNRTPFGQRTGWEQQLNDWLAELGERFGYDASWLLQELHLQGLQEHGLGQGWSTRQLDAFQRQGGYAFHALWLWNVPDVELRAWLRRQLQAHPEQGEWLWKAMTLLGFTTALQPGKPLPVPPKRTLVTLLNRYPTPRELYLALRERQTGAPPVAPSALPPTGATQSASPQSSAKEPPTDAPREPPTAAQEEQSHPPAVFAVVSPGFARSTPPTIDRIMPPAPPAPAQPVDQGRSASLSGPTRPDPAIAYQPVHTAWVALFQAIEHLSARHGREWLRWEQAQADLAQLRVLVSPDNRVV